MADRKFSVYKIEGGSRELIAARWTMPEAHSLMSEEASAVAAAGKNRNYDTGSTSARVFEHDGTELLLYEIVEEDTNRL